MNTANAQPRAYQHERLQELAGRLQGLGKISEAIIRTVREVVSPTETILVCYYELELNQQGTDFFSCEIHLLTSQHDIHLGFFPKFHSYQVRQVHRIREIKVENHFSLGFAEEEEGAQTPEQRNFAPAWMKLQVLYEDEKGGPAGEWLIETTRPANLGILSSQVKLLNRLVGYPLSQVRLPEKVDR